MTVTMTMTKNKIQNQSLRGTCFFISTYTFLLVIQFSVLVIEMQKDVLGFWGNHLRFVVGKVCPSSYLTPS